ncbi:DUF4403 family protein [Polaribacter porphyrae]|uniref:DUF4403 domain-containing protein n=1 Tax=Polaribacter porphyrae TaxID=1137780 RepID=A0A2S7WRB4_9FLAO|nr:DUF4403 family protein [Polaribacter porphyrae]PQJ80134.1 hypothetical protein BTO18_13535 [Polaribacter porphyrae]
MKKIILILTIVLLTSCAKKIYPEKPSKGTIKKVEYKNSFITLPFNFSIKEIQNLLNTKIPKGLVYHQKNGIGGFYRSDVRLYRNSPISFTVSGSKLRFAIPIKVDVYGAKRKKIFFAYVTKTGRGTARATVYLDVDLKLKPDYSFDVATDLNASLHQAVIKIPLLGNIVGPIFGNPKITISVKSLVKPELKKAINKAIPNLNNLLKAEVNKVNIKKEVEKYWTKLGKPINLQENAWLETKPTGLYFNNISSNSNSFNIKVGLSSKLKLAYKDAPKIYKDPQPNLTVDQLKDGNFNIYLPTSISFDKLEKEINEKIAGKTYFSKNKKHKVKVNKIFIYGSKNVDAQTIAIGIDFKGKIKGLFKKRVKGELWFNLFPEYDSITKVVRLKDLKFTSNTNSILIDKAVPWLADKFYMEKILDESKVEIAGDLENYKKLINEEIKEIILDKLTIKGALKSLNFEGFNIGKEKMILLITADGILKTSPIKIE